MDSEKLADKSSPTSSLPIAVKREKFPLFSSSVKGFGLKIRNQNQNSQNTARRTSAVGANGGKRLPIGTTPTLSSVLTSSNRSQSASLQILAQPEEQHRARYQTEGSRGAIKDRKGNGFPTVQLVGYNKPATLQIFIGTDQGKVNPHMFYQACKVTGKSSTPCLEKKTEGTVVIEIEFEPSKDMIIK